MRNFGVDQIELEKITEMDIPALVLSNTKNDNFWSFGKINKETVRIYQVPTFFMESHKKLFNYYGGDLGADTKWFIGYTAVLLKPDSGEIFMRDFGRFTFLLKHLPSNFKKIQELETLDGKVNIASMGKEWSHFYGTENKIADALVVKKIFDRI